MSDYEHQHIFAQADRITNLEARLDNLEIQFLYAKLFASILFVMLSLLSLLATIQISSLKDYVLSRRGEIDE